MCTPAVERVVVADGHLSLTGAPYDTGLPIPKARCGHGREAAKAKTSTLHGVDTSIAGEEQR